MDIKESIRTKAHEIGFDAVGFARAEGNPEDAQHLADYVAGGRHGDMDWMARTADRRANPMVLWPDARTLVCLGLNYGPVESPLAAHQCRNRGAISVYAKGSDYHKVLKTKLKALARWITETHGGEAKVFVDTAPVMEKPAAMRAGLGWIGKHTNLVSRRFGSWLFLGEVFTTLEIAPDEAEVDHCGSCDACLRACPTHALPEPYRIEPRRCVSYLTIEHKGEIAPELRPFIGNRVYGCDDCLAACPWNKFATPTAHENLWPRAELAAPRLADLADLDKAAFFELFAGTAIKRTGRDRFVRSVLIALGNSANTELASTAERCAADASPLVSETARWAANRLTSGQPS